MFTTCRETAYDESMNLFHTPCCEVVILDLPTIKTEIFQYENSIGLEL